MSKKLTKAQRRLIESLRAGKRLWVFGDNGLKLDGVGVGYDASVRLPQDRTVRILLKKGLLRRKPYKNETQCRCGVCELEMTGD